MIITMKQAPSLVMDVLKAGLVPFVQSSPGLGKSSMAKDIADKYHLELIDIRLAQMDPTDLQGLPFKDNKTSKAIYAPMGTFPLKGDPLPEGKKGWLLLLDEMNSAPPAVQAAAYRVVLDRQVGQFDLHEAVAIMAAGNLMTDKAIVNRQSTAMQSRLVHFTLEVDKDAWIAWADAHDVDHRVKSFIQWKPESLFRFDPNHAEESFPTPRTWDFVSKLITPYPEFPAGKLPLIAGSIGEGMAREFFGFIKVFAELPKIESIIRNPDTITMPDEPSVQHALTGLVAYHLSEKNADNLMKFVNRLNIDYQVICLMSAIAKRPEVKDTDSIREWIRINARELV